MSDDWNNNDPNKKGNGTDGAWGFVSEQPGGMSMGDAKNIQDRVLQLMETNDVNAKINGAAQLMTEGEFDACIQAYAHIKNAHPEQAALCESQVGAAEFFKGNFDNAIQHYQLAKSLGADEGMMDMNIAEAEEKMGSSQTMAMGSLQPPQSAPAQAAPAPQQQGGFVPVGGYAEPAQQHGQPMPQQSHANQVPMNTAQTQTLESNDIIALCLSFFIFPGVGHIISGQAIKGMAIIFGTIFTCGLGGLMWPLIAVDLYMVLMAKKQREVTEWEIFPKV